MTTAYPIEEMVESALASLAADLPDTDEVEPVELVLEYAGDALRAGVPLPRSISKWMASLSSEVLGEVAARWVARLEAEVLPGSDEELEMLSGAAVLRDRSESAVVAIRRACVGATRAFSDVRGLDALLDVQGAFVEHLREHVSRSAVEGALGIRRGLLASRSWTDGLREAEGAAIDDGEPSFPGGVLPAAAAPSHAILARYVAHGLHASWVEGFADRSPDFAEVLVATIAGSKGAGETVSLVARRWHARQKSTVVVPLGLELAAAAADEASERVEVQLGTLAPTDAEARLLVDQGRITMRVLAGPVALRSVRFGTMTLETDPARDRWELSCDWTEEPIHFAVESADGRRFEVELRLARGRDE